MPAPESVQILVKNFQEHLESYQKRGYNETELRRDFLDKFFEALGWDVANTKNYSEKYREVIHEASVEVEGHAKAADYAFQIGQGPVFFVEAKKPAVKIGESIEAAYQIRRYGWSAQLSLSILTDFEQMAVYDCRIKPRIDDPTSRGRVKLYSFTDYIDKWDEIAGIFSREAVCKGAFDQFAKEVKGKQGTADVDDAFLEEMERWRDELAHNVALRNLNLNQREINIAVLNTINRIIFLRICEDRGIEPLDSLRNVAESKDVYSNLLERFKVADKKYNSGLFHFTEEKGQSSAPDTLALHLKIDDKVLKDIINHLYYPVSPYAFKYIPVDILGQVYERFLGKVITLTDGHRAKVVEKPEVRKAGGVFYTPTYIVNYIVKNTLGVRLKDQTPEEQSKASLRVLDPSCGSGSFLLGAYQFLLDWYLDWYSQNDPVKWSRGKNPAIIEVPNGWILTMNKKKEILLNHIFGVDIDAQAVEVTKLSLLMKVVEGFGQLSLLDERILPDLSLNIRCGNSLIGPDYYNNRTMPMFGDEEFYRINVFDWARAFPQIFNAGGFDVVVGNPPYIRIQALKEWAPTEVEFYKQRYKAAAKGNYDIYVVFVEKALSLLNSKGLLGYILPHKFFNAKYGEPLRDILAKGKHLWEIVHFGAQQVFENATTYTCLLFLSKTSGENFYFEKPSDIKTWRDEKHERTNTENIISSEAVAASEWNFKVGTGSDLFQKLRSFPIRLGDIADIFVGIQTSADDVFIMNCVEETSTSIVLESKALQTTWEFEKQFVYPLVSGTDVNRYSKLPERQYLLFPYEIKGEKAKLVDFNELSLKCPKTTAYLKRNKARLENRETGKMKGPKWYGYVYLKNMARQTIKKLCVPRLVDELYAAYDETGTHFLDNVDVGGIVFKTAYSNIDIRYLLALLNSSLLRWYFPSVSAPFRGGWLSANKQFLSQLPICLVDPANHADYLCYQKILSLVDRILDLYGQLATAQIPQDKELIQRYIDATSQQIDDIVFDLYGITVAEKCVIEGRTAG